MTGEMNKESVVERLLVVKRLFDLGRTQADARKFYSSHMVSKYWTLFQVNKRWPTLNIVERIINGEIDVRRIKKKDMLALLEAKRPNVKTIGIFFNALAD